MKHIRKKNRQNSFLVFVFVISSLRLTQAQDIQRRWALGKDNDIIWNISQDKRLPHQDNVEMSGYGVSTIVTYGVDKQRHASLNALVIWPSYIVKYDYRSYLQKSYPLDSLFIKVDGQPVAVSLVSQVRFNGILELQYQHSRLRIKRFIYPAVNDPAVYDRVEIDNTGKKDARIEVEKANREELVVGENTKWTMALARAETNQLIKPGESTIVTTILSARKAEQSPGKYDAEKDYQGRLGFIKKINQNLHFNSPDPEMNLAFQFAKFRTSESIFDSDLGRVHSPGGGRYYGGVWANDQVEYANPFFAMLGYDEAEKASMNAYKAFMPKMTSEFSPIPSSFEMGGKMVFSGAGDRGDAAMYAYGASLYALLSGDRQVADTLWPAIVWCLDYCERKTNEAGVIASKTDEMEGRIPTGTANLSTSTLAYAGFTYASRLAKALNKESAISTHYEQKASDLKKAIETYFGANVEGYDTYKYYKEHNKLRHWICLPLVMGIETRKEGTIKALFEKLWTKNGLLVEDGQTIFWDRATLYALRGVIKVGAVEVGMSKLKAYSTQRLLGDHVPYPVEAYPEGNQAHLAAESALYCRIITEGLFGIEPLSLTEFQCLPRLPKDWNKMELLNVQALGKAVDIKVNSVPGNKVRLVVEEGGKQIFAQEAMANTAFTVKLN